MEVQLQESQLLQDYLEVRNQTNFLCEPLEKEDFVVQPVVDVSPLKWHLAHTTWFFENFVLVPNHKDYKVFHSRYAFLFNSYYISSGERWTRANRGQLTRPTVDEIFAYRAYVDEHMQSFIQRNVDSEVAKLIELGLNHEQQHQELFLYDIKRILGDNPLFPVYRESVATHQSCQPFEWLTINEGAYEIGYEGTDFHFDNEEGKHKTFLHACQVGSRLVTNRDYLEFIADGGYQKFQFWLSEAWDWLNREQLDCPRYWQKEGETWYNYTLAGYQPIDLDAPLVHVSYYEADAYARWKGCRLPTEFEWEVACQHYEPLNPPTSNFVEDLHFHPVTTSGHDFYGNVWEWTSSAYLPYPYFNPPEGAVGEYNGKFMINQMVLRGGSFATPRKHIRNTYRNFFHPHLRWLFSGFRLAKHL